MRGLGCRILKGFTATGHGSSGDGSTDTQASDCPTRLLTTDHVIEYHHGDAPGDTEQRLHDGEVAFDSA